MEEKLKINKLEIRDWMNIGHIVLSINGESVTLRGDNGAGKSAILLAIMAGLHGKSMFPKGFDYQQLIKKGGSGSAKVSIDLGDGVKTMLTTKVSITQSDMYLNINAFDNDGKEIAIPGGPASFAKKLVGAISFDPQAFKSLPMKEKVKVIYDMCPGLQDEMDRLDKKYDDVKSERQDINSEIKVLDAQLSNIEFDASAPPKHVDVTSLATEMQQAIEHNRTSESMKVTLQNSSRAASDADEKAKSIQNRIAELSKDLDDVLAVRKAASEKVESVSADIERFKPVDTTSIQERIDNFSKINDAVSKNKTYSELKIQIDKKKQDYQDGLKRMKDVEEERLKVVQDSSMPLDGLSIDNGSLVYLDTETFTVRNVDMLSSGQFWTFAIKLYCAINPKLSFIIVPNLNDLDKVNAEIISTVAEEHGLQLLTHETIASKEKIGLQIKIADGSVGVE